MAKCPFWKKPCERVESCHMRRVGLRYYDNGRKPDPFEECAILLAVDLLENMTSRMVGVQGASESVRNQVNKVNQFIEQLKDLKSIKALEDKDERS